MTRKEMIRYYLRLVRQYASGREQWTENEARLWLAIESLGKVIEMMLEEEKER